MKKAKIKDFWDDLGRVPSKSKGIVRIDQAINDGVRTIHPDGIFAIVGLNGSGKSCFFEFLTNPNYSRLPFAEHQIFLYDGTAIRIPNERLSAQMVDPTAMLRKNNQALDGFRTVFGQQDMIKVKEDETSLLNYVLGSSYDNILIEEIQISDAEVCVRFVATVGSLTVDNDSLSLGEQLVFYIYWLLTKKYQRPGVYLIEEPESGLSPAAQKKLVDFLAYISAEKAKQIFISTHSPFIVSRLGRERVLLLKKGVTSTWINAGKTDYLEELGMDLGLQGVLYVEDNKARIFLEKLLSLYGSELVKTYDVVFLGGESEVYEVVYRLPPAASILRTVGVLDADQKAEQKYANFPNQFFFLPGTRPPEKELLAAILTHRAEYARALLTREGLVSDAIRRCEGLNHHDFFEELSRVLYGEVRPSVYEQAFGVWFKNYHNREEIHSLMRLLDPALPSENIAEVDNIFPPLPTAAVQ